MLKLRSSTEEQDAIERAMYDVMMAIPQLNETRGVDTLVSESDVPGSAELWRAVSAQSVIHELQASLVAAEKLANYLRQDKEKCQNAMRASGERHRREVTAIQQQLAASRDTCEQMRLTTIDLNQRIDAHAEVILRQEKQIRDLKTQLRHALRSRGKGAEKERSLRSQTTHRLMQENTALRNRCETLRVELYRCRSENAVERARLIDGAEDSCVELRASHEETERLRMQVTVKNTRYT